MTTALVPYFEGPLQQMRELERQLLEKDIEVELAKPPPKACCAGGCGCGAKLQLLVHEEDVPRVAKLMQAEWLAAPRPRLADDLLLVVSELDTNAERHSHGPYVLELEGTDSLLSVTVYDSSSALPRWYEPDPTRLGGHGLEIVRAVADHVTAERVPVGKRVTATFTLAPQAAG